MSLTTMCRTSSGVSSTFEPREGCIHSSVIEVPTSFPTSSVKQQKGLQFLSGTLSETGFAFLQSSFLFLKKNFETDFLMR